MGVLFFASSNKMNKQYHSYSQDMSLQVHYPLLARRAHPCTSSLPASMTVEAALVLPLALFFFLALLKPVTWLDRQRKVQTAMERIGEEISQYGILAESVETGDSELPAFWSGTAGKDSGRDALCRAPDAAVSSVPIIQTAAAITSPPISGRKGY